MSGHSVTAVGQPEPSVLPSIHSVCPVFYCVPYKIERQKQDTHTHTHARTHARTRYSYLVANIPMAEQQACALQMQ
jgi:hypothetical protein